MLSVSLDYPLLITPSVFSNVNYDSVGRVPVNSLMLIMIVLDVFPSIL